MTLEEAKKEIDRMTEEKWKTYENTCYTTTLGEAYGLEEAISILDQVDGEPVGKADTLTLTDLAHELKKIIAFDCITVHKNWCQEPAIFLWSGKPEYIPTQDVGGWQSVIGKSKGLCWFGVYSIIGGLDLSEYKDADGKIDYSRCIVEVE